MSTPAPSLALVLPGQPARELAPGASSTAARRALELVHQLLVDSGASVHDLARVIVGVGPGGFTGVRIGIATALGLGQALGIPVIGASSLEALALGVDGLSPGSTIAAITDARRGEVFAASYRHGGDDLQPRISAGAYDPADFAARLAADDAATVCVGTGALVYAEAFTSAGLTVRPEEDPAHAVRALHLISRVEHGASRPARPDYQRLPDAEVNRLVALGR
jgi:tRNA threonylcarbamoyladenosine biosynthesis protein TsaB